LARPALGEFGDVFGQPIEVDDMGIEVVGEPFFEFAMALMFGIGDGLDELPIAPIPAGEKTSSCRRMLTVLMQKLVQGSQNHC
jgi:hypothetical protein